MRFGIDNFSFYTSRYYLDLAALAAAHNIDPTKFYNDLGQKRMAVAPPGEDAVTLAANAAIRILVDIDINSIETLIIATESGIDSSKSAGIYVHKLLDLSPRCRVIELKQACYSATAGLQMAMAMLHQNPDSKILLIATDVACYAKDSTAESSQGAGAVAMLLSTNPQTLIIEPGAGFYTQDVMDFWRPEYCAYPFVDGRLSCEMYIKVLEKTWQQYTAITGRAFADHQHFCYHVPVPKLVLKAHRHLVKKHSANNPNAEQLAQQLSHSLTYSREMGNCYTASLYLSIISLLDNYDINLSGQRLGLYSYGSGCVGEFFSAKIADNYSAKLHTQYHQSILTNRSELSHQEYLQFHDFTLPQDGRAMTLPKYDTGQFRLTAIENHKRIYEQLF